MTSKLAQDIEEVLKSVTYAPCVSIFMTFEPKMLAKSELEMKLRQTIRKAEKDLMESYPEVKARAVLEKLRSMIKELDYTTYKKSIAIFISPDKEKLFYLDFPVEERVIIDHSLEIRDLVYSKKEMQKYLLLVLSEKRSRIYLGGNNGFVRIVTNIPDHVAAYKKDTPGQAGNFYNPADRKDVMLGNFLRHTDGGLSILLRAYPLPLFVIGTDRVIEYFNRTTQNKNKIFGFIEGNYEEASEGELRKVMEPLISDWKKVKQQDLLNRMQEAEGNKKLVTGIEKVWKESMQKKGKLLIVEKNFNFPVRFKEVRNDLYNMEVWKEDGSTVKDVVDEVIEKVFENGGDVEFVEDGVLKEQGRIVLTL